jgi:hypothetical protein
MASRLEIVPSARQRKEGRGEAHSLCTGGQEEAEDWHYEHILDTGQYLYDCCGLQGAIYVSTRDRGHFAEPFDVS